MITHRYKLPGFPFSAIGKRFLEYVHKFKLKSVDSVFAARELATPVLMIHSLNDDTVPIENAHRIFAQIAAPKDLWIVSGSGHARIFTDMPDEYQKRVHAFLNALEN